MLKTIDIGLPVSVTRILMPGIETRASKMSIVFRNLQEEEIPPLPDDPLNIPDLITTHQISIIQNRDKMVESGHFEDLRGRLPQMRSDLQDLGFEDTTGCFKTVCIVPLILIYARNLERPPVSWIELTDARWKGRIGTSSPMIIRKLLRFYANEWLGKDAPGLLNNIVFEGIPVDMNLKVDSGQIDIGIVPLPFARSSRNRNILNCWPKEGAACVPQVLIHKKGSLEYTEKISRYLLSCEVQRFMSESGVLIPVNAEVELPQEVIENRLNLYWKGWDWFVRGLKNIQWQEKDMPGNVNNNQQPDY